MGNICLISTHWSTLQKSTVNINIQTLTLYYFQHDLECSNSNLAMACTNVYRMIFINTAMRKRTRLWVKISKMHRAKYYPKNGLFFFFYDFEIWPRQFFVGLQICADVNNRPFRFEWIRALQRLLVYIHFHLALQIFESVTRPSHYRIKFPLKRRLDFQLAFSPHSKMPSNGFSPASHQHWTDLHYSAVCQ